MVQRRPAGEKGRDLALLAHLPQHVGLDLGVIEIEHQHLGRASGRAARANRARRAIADFEKRHQPTGKAAAAQRLAEAAQIAEVGAATRAKLEEPRLARPQIEDAALVHQIVLDPLDETRVRGRMLVGVVGEADHPAFRIDEPVSLRRARDTVRGKQTGVEPLRAIGRRPLACQLEAQLVVKHRGVFRGGKIPQALAPGLPAAGEAIEDLARVGLHDSRFSEIFGGEDLGREP